MEGSEHCYISETLKDQLIITEEYKLSDQFKEKLKAKPEPFVTDLAQSVYYRTYSRKLSNGENERWADTIIRVIEGTISAYVTHMRKNHLELRSDLDVFAEKMAMSAFNRQWLPPGRGLYCMGTEFVRYRGNASLNNCYAVATGDNFVKAASWAMDQLCLGGGVGFDTRWKGECIIPNKSDTWTYVVPDSREGWVSSLELLLRSYIPIAGKITNKYPTFDFSKVRPFGAPIKGFGGTASGPEPLRVLLKRVEAFSDSYAQFLKGVDSKTIYQRQLKFLQKHNAYDCVLNTNVDDVISKINESIDKNPDLKLYNSIRYIVDVFNAIGACVVAGNVRRSSQIAIGDAGVDEASNLSCNIFVNMKNYEVNPERMPWGWNSNNTVRFSSNKNFEDWIPVISELVKVNGEPGIFNLLNVQKFGRYSDISRGPDTACLTNPCGEICLDSYEPCTLSIICPYHCRSEPGAELDINLMMDAVEFANFYAMTVTTIPHHWAVSNAVIAKNRRIGISFSGVTNIYETIGQHKLTNIARQLYHHAEKCNTEFASHAGIPRSIRITTIKPEGTTSLITELNPGIHFAIMQYYIRRVNLSITSPLVKAFQDAGYPVEDSIYTPQTKVLCIPMCSGNGRPASQVSMFEQLGLITSMQRHWADNSISVTVTFNKDTEAKTVPNAIAMYVPHLKTVSFLGMEGDGATNSSYKQAPYEKISQDEYLHMISKIGRVDWNSLYTLGSSDGIRPKFCTNDTCSI